MKYYHLSGGNGYCGCDWDEYIAFYDDVSMDEIENYANELAYENAEAYEYVATGWDKDRESEEDSDEYYTRDEYYASISDYTNWEEVTEEEYLANT